MQQITILLNDRTAERLQALAQQRGQTLEQTAQSLLLSTFLTSAPDESVTSMTLPTPVILGTHLAPDDPDGTRLTLSLAGIIPFWPEPEGPEGQVTHTTNEDIDRILADEAMNPHVDE